MSELPIEVWLTPEAEAERLWKGAQEACRTAPENVVRLSEALDLGIRVVEILTVCCLQPVRDEFPTTIGTMLDSLPPEVDPERDFLHPPKSLQFVDVIDLLSGQDLSCISPQLHHGWEDRRQSCRRSRVRTRTVTGFSVDETQRKSLILIGAYRNRIFQTPPPVKVMPREVLDAYPVLVELVNRLFAAARNVQGKSSSSTV